MQRDATILKKKPNNLYLILSRETDTQTDEEGKRL